MSETVLSQRSRVRLLVTLIGALAVVATTSSLTWPILAESLRNQGYSESAINLNAAAQFSGIVIIAFLATRVIPRLGFLRAIAVGLGLVAAMLVLLPLTRDYHT